MLARVSNNNRKPYNPTFRPRNDTSIYAALNVERAVQFTSVLGEASIEIPSRSVDTSRSRLYSQHDLVTVRTYSTRLSSSIVSDSVHLAVVDVAYA